MAYFANGTEGQLYEAQYCDKCLHRGDPNEGECCPILLLHSFWNYDQCSDEEKEMALDLFIPRRKIHNQQCEMFIEHKELFDWEINPEPVQAADFLMMDEGVPVELVSPDRLKCRVIEQEVLR